MADSFLFSVAESVLGKLGSLALEEFFMACGLQSEVEEIKKTMIAINAVLLDAEQRQSQNHAIEVWVRELKDVICDIEDLADEFECEALRRQVVKSGRTTRKVQRFFSTSNPLVFRFRMAHVVKNIKERLDKITALKSSLGLSERVNDMPIIIHQERLTHSFVRKEDVIGREDDKENIINLVLQPNDGENVSVIPIVGIGGLGKTTLAKLVYNDERVVHHFQKKLWVCVSEEFELRKLIILILESLGVEEKEYKDKHIEQLQKILREPLDEKRYFLVLDDVWNEDSRKWLQLKELLLGGSNGSRIVVTTRSNRVASIMGTLSAYNLHDLSHDHCLSLFFKYAFKEVKGKQNPELERIGEEIVRKCNGVPLAVITLATLLNSTDKREWESVRDNEIWRLEQRETDILPALKLSYKHLPPHLKRCFAYCSVFPKDWTFRDVDLVYYWIANGLIRSSSSNQELEDIGFRYFKELSFRCFFQDIQEFVFDTIFKMHDLMHDLAVSVTQNEISTILSNDQEISRGVRHLSFPYPDSLSNYLSKSSQSLYHVRTIFCANEFDKGFTVKQISETCLSRCHYLRYLDFPSSKIKKLPHIIGNLKHLRYLSLWGCYRLKSLPNSICKLQNLQMLNLGACYQLRELPRDIKYLISLRSLRISTTEKRLPKGRIGCLKSLRFLEILECHNLECLFEDMEGLQRLQVMSINGCEGFFSLKCIQCLTSLDTLTISFNRNLDLKIEESKNSQHSTQFSLRKLYIAELPKLEDFPEWLLRGSVNNLQIFIIEGCPNLRQVPEWVRKIPTLQKFSIKDCQLIEDSVPSKRMSVT